MFFRYNVFDYVLYIVSFWCISLVLSVPFIFAALRKIEPEILTQSTWDEKQKEILNNRNLAHDIRSPLSALDMSIKSLQFTDPKQKQLVRSAINRIHDIANNLVGKTETLESKEIVDSILLTSTLSSIISEKRTEFRNLNHIDIDFVLSNVNYGLFSNIESNELKRIISNIINNSVEAIDKPFGDIEIKLETRNEFNDIIIIDNGKGISSDNIESIFDDGVTIDKPDGTGIGLFHAKVKLEEWGGSIRCESIEGASTRFTLSLPKSTPPASFVTAISMNQTDRVIIVDDDSSIHQVWKGRFESLQFNTSQTIVFSDPTKFLSWYEHNKMENDIYLVDYEFLGHEVNGLDIMDKIEASKKYLITSRYEESHIKNKCDKDGIQLIDKGMIGFVPIQISEAVKALREKVIFIDDDELMHMSWSMEAKKEDIDLTCFYTIDEFIKSSNEFNKETKIYIDSNLANGIKGEVESEKISKLGFTELYLATGYSASDIDKPAWIKDIVGKRANFSCV